MENIFEKFFTRMTENRQRQFFSTTSTPKRWDNKGIGHCFDCFFDC